MGRFRTAKAMKSLPNPCPCSPLKSRVLRLAGTFGIVVSTLASTARASSIEFSGETVTIPSSGNATPYPSTILVSGVTGDVSAVKVKLNGLSHEFPADMDMFLVAPSGQVSVVLSDAIGSNANAISGLNLVFDDAAAVVIPQSSPVSSGTYRPANYGAPVENVPPGATGPIGTNLTALAAGGANGEWKLFVSDDAGGDVGSIDSWSLVFLTSTPPGTFAGTGSLASGRTAHSATLLPDGRVFVTGGYEVEDSPGNPEFVPSAEIYDPATGAWTAAATPSVARKNHTASVLRNGRVLVVGGYGPGDTPVSSVEIYDPVANLWLPTGPLAKERAFHTATSLPDGRVLVTGGQTLLSSAYLASAEIYDPSTGTWSPAGALSDIRWFHNAVLLADGRVLVAGGRDGNFAGFPPQSSSLAEIYNPATGSWSLTGPLNLGRSNHTLILLPDGRVLAAGGVQTSEIYNPATGSWSVAGTMSVKRSNPSASLMPNGRVLVTGGNSDPGLNASSEEFDPASGNWSPGPALGTARANHTATLLPGGRLLVTGGNGGTSPPFRLASSEILSPPAGTWNPAGEFDQRFGHTATLLPDGRVLFLGGALSLLQSDPRTARLFDPTTDSWADATQPETFRYRHTATLLASGKILMTGGGDPSQVAEESQLYEPTSDTWSNTANFPAFKSHSHSATLLPDGKVLVAGGYGTPDASSPTTLNRAEIYDPVTNGWSSAPSTMNSVHSNHTATLLHDGKILVAGGGYTGTSELYDHRYGTWAYTEGMNHSRDYHTATLLPDGRVLVAGGFNLAVGKLASAEIYDPATGTWSLAENMNVARQGHTATLLLDGTVLVSGGANGTDSAEIYDPATGIWSLATPMPGPRDHRTATLLPDGRVLLTAGGAVTAEIYDPSGGAPPYTRPEITTAFINSAGKLVLGGSGFRGFSEASGGYGASNSATNFPLVRLQLLDSGRTLTLSPDPGAPFSATAFTSAALPSYPGGFAPRPLFPGYAVATVIANGIPSAAAIVTRFGPDFSVEQPVSTAVPHGGSRRFVTTPGSSASLAFSIRNTGGTSLDTLDFSISGPDAGEFGYSAATTPIAAGESALFVVLFNPTSGGTRNAVLRITSPVPGKSPFEILLEGRALTPDLDSDGDGLGDAIEFGMAALGFDWETSQPALVDTLFTNANGAGLFTTAQVRDLHVDTPLIERNPANGQFKLTLGLQKSTDLSGFAAFPFTAPPTVNGEGKIEYWFTSPDDSAFFRVSAE